MEKFDRTDYSRVLGGIAWPGKRPGLSVIVGEHFHGHPAYSTPIYRILDEVESEDINRLLQRTSAPHTFYKVKLWFGDTEHEAARKLLRELNDDLEVNRIPRIDMLKAPFVSSPTGFQYLFSTVKRLLDPAHKRLYLGKKSRVPAYLLEPQATEIVDIQKGDFPAIEALGYVVAYMENNPYEGNLGDSSKKEPEYDPFSFLTNQW